MRVSDDVRILASLVSKVVWNCGKKGILDYENLFWTRQQGNITHNYSWTSLREFLYEQELETAFL